MTVLDVFLAEAFPPSKKPVGGPGKPPGAAGGKPPVGGAKPGAAGKPPTDDDANGPAGPGAGMGMGGGMGDNSDALIAAQQAEEEKARQEAEAAAASRAAEQAERDHIKELRAAADQEVADDLDTKFNDEDDQVIWHPTVDAVLYGGLDDGKGDSFADHLDKKMGLKKEDEEDTDEEGHNDEDSVKEDEEDETEDRKGSIPDDKKGKTKDSLADGEVEDEGDPERLSKKKPKDRTSKPAQRGDIVIKV
jgi:hypothetical protein